MSRDWLLRRHFLLFPSFLFLPSLRAGSYSGSRVPKRLMNTWDWPDVPRVNEQSASPHSKTKTISGLRDHPSGLFIVPSDDSVTMYFIIDLK